MPYTNLLGDQEASLLQEATRLDGEHPEPIGLSKSGAGPEKLQRSHI
jgi:hypothetical protein